jgi:hypothetical protein
MEMKKTKQRQTNLVDAIKKLDYDYTWSLRERPHSEKLGEYKFDDLGPTDFELDLWEISDTLTNLLLKKHKDYGPKNISGSPGGPLNGLRVRMWDKMARINHLLDNDFNAVNEPLEDSFADLANYSIIALMVMKGKWPTE